MKGQVSQENSTSPDQISPQDTQPNKVIRILITIVIALLILLIISTFFFISQNKKEEPIVDENPTPTIKQSRNVQKDVSTFIPGPIENWKAPTKYLTFDANGNLILAMINNSETYHLVTKYQSKYFGITDPKFSPDGMYVTYLTLPKSILDEFEKEPPYEFHGSSDYELHLLNISNPSQPTDTLIAGAVAFYGLDSLPGMRWRSNTTLTYATWNTEKSIQEYHLYDIESRSLSDIVKEDNDWQTISPSGKYYSVFEKSPKTQTNPQSISGYVNLLIGDTTTGKEELVYKDFLINEADTVFIDDDHLILTREDFARHQ